ncbi:MAG TPA: hypothetical protein VEK76_06420 [Candidatus Binatia bacterium]|nr:hypothetical protein [Candidatus Binatia bacterium]
MASLAPLRHLRQPLERVVVRSATRLVAVPRHPMAPAAVRVERTRARRGGETAEQTAITLWFQEGPQLPSPSLSRSPWRVAAGVGVTLVGAAAVAVASSLAAQREEQRRIQAVRPVRTIAAPATAGAAD